MKKVIEVKNLTKEYKNLKAIDNLSFDVYNVNLYQDCYMSSGTSYVGVMIVY